MNNMSENQIKKIVNNYYCDGRNEKGLCRCRYLSTSFSAVETVGDGIGGVVLLEVVCKGVSFELGCYCSLSSFYLLMKI